MANFSPELHKAASGAKSLPVSKARSDEPFETPVFEDYLANNDIAGYMTALWKGAAARDIESLRYLIYLAIKCHEPEDALDLMDMLADTDDDYVTILGKIVNKFVNDAKKWPPEIYNDDKKYKQKLSIEFDSALCLADLAYERVNKNYTRDISPFYRFGQTETALLRAYLNNVGRHTDVQTPVEDVPLQDLVPQERKDYWRGLYSRSDCSSNQESIYNEALPYAEQGDPYAMFIVGYLLRYGIRTKYSNPNVTILEPDHARALTFLKRATEANIAPAFWLVADLMPNDEEALPWLEKGAELGNANCLESMFKHHVEAKDDEKAFGYLVRLADAYGSHKYTLELARWYEQGRGCEKDEKKAYELAEYVYNHSSMSPYDSSHEDSVELICRYLREGIGCEPNPVRAGDIYRSMKDDEDDLYELLCK